MQRQVCTAGSFLARKRAPTRSVLRTFSVASGEKKNVGFIGLGNMGSRMAPHILKHGHNLTVFDLSSSSVEQLVQLGAKSSTNPAEIAQNSDILITMLPASKHVKDVYTNPKTGIFAGIKAAGPIKGHRLLIDTSTIDPQTAKDIGEQCKAQFGSSVTFVDAPVSGGVGGAQAGTLTFMVGADGQLFDEVKPVLQMMGKNIVSCGALGTGQIAKICNNLVLGISMAAVSEGMLLGANLGIDPKILAGIFNTSSARCWSSDTYNPYPGVMENVPSSRGYTGGFGAKLMLKDMGLAVDAAKSIGNPLPLGELTASLYTAVSNHPELAESDFSAIIQYLKTQKK